MYELEISDEEFEYLSSESPVVGRQITKNRQLKSKTIPLIVDIDGTLVRGDLLVEGLVRLLASAPHKLLAVPVWLASGRAALKRRVAGAAPLTPEMLVLNDEVLELIATARREGQPIFLATGSDESNATMLAEHLGVDGVLASDGRENLTGEAKAAKLVTRFGEGGFDYIGNERRDLPVWRRARRAIVVQPSRVLAKSVRAQNSNVEIIQVGGGRLRDYVGALRPHHWVKNLLVFAPLIASYITDAQAIVNSVLAFVALSICASGTYMLNDMLDVPNDRRHETKRSRALASGNVPLIHAGILAVMLVSCGLAVAYAVSLMLVGAIGAYLIVTCAYSFYMKRKMFMDVITLASLYTLRILIGAVAITVLVSPWFLGFAIFIFLTLAIVKRQRELIRLRSAGELGAFGRSYLVEDLPVLAALASASGFASVVVMALFISSDAVGVQYSHPEVLWLLCPLLAYWLGRIILLANRGEIDDDPLVYAMRDKASWAVVLAGAAVLFGAL